MARAQQIINICERRMGGGPVVMFHGTSSAFLRKILKQGLIPDPRDKYWAEDPDARFGVLSRVSYPGTYFTENAMTAMSSASNTIRKFPGNKIYIVAQIQQRSAVVDEDQIASRIERINVFNNERQLIELYRDMYGDPHNRNRRPSTDYTRRVYARWLNEVNNTIKEHVDPRAITPDVTMKLFISIVKRQASYLRYQPGMFYGLEDLEAPDKREAEAEYRRAMDVFLHKVKALAVNYRKGYDPKETFMHNVRVTEPVTYRGHNRILAVYEDVSGPWEKDKPMELKIHYGKPIPEFEKDFRQRWGNFVWV